ncbi:serine protease [Aeromicrobium sp. PE09-221]|uniref:SDH family Clp fold serine proteinase n=1 Tax=Aeromicrobium sp. PE09-221 TaxID=1898043 RepID=UPI000B3E648F|nr:ATP-dependent Clp protease proteolytic subunit [Aeromicrobium sp. PE09-221]OUZ06743.1 serine protease [Aeromicrobium sp. PE09-221]
MPNWAQLLSEINSQGSVHDVVRRRYVKELSNLTGRNVIVYYSGWLEKQDLIRQGLTGFEVNDSDKNGFMAVIHGMDRSKGLDLILHTPGGDIAATESLVDYLRAMFKNDIRVIVPQLAMSAGTMIALSSDEIILGKHSSLGPIDPQINGAPAHAIKEEFDRATRDISINPASIPVWQPIIAKYSPTLIGECEKAIDWSNKMVKQWLETGMFRDHSDKESKADRVISELGDHALTQTHARHISFEKAAGLDLKVTRLESLGQDMQNAVLSVHHACGLTVSSTPAFKIIENQNDVGFISSANMMLTPAPFQAMPQQPGPDPQQP